MKITFRPQSFFSWNFELSGERDRAKVEFHWLTEQGEITTQDGNYKIVKDGFLSGRWDLLSEDGKTQYSAHKPNPFTRRFEITGPGLQGVLQASGLGRRMNFTSRGGDLSIATNHLFTRGGQIQGTIDDFALSSFAFWLSALTWRRMARRNNGSSAGSP